MRTRKVWKVKLSKPTKTEDKNAKIKEQATLESTGKKKNKKKTGKQ
jgi:hypothetical protein